MSPMRSRTDSASSASSFEHISRDGQCPTTSQLNPHLPSSEQLSLVIRDETPLIRNKRHASFVATLTSSPNSQHARRILCVLLALRRPPKLAEAKVVFALTAHQLDGTRPTCYKELRSTWDDDEFKKLLKRTCGTTIEFVKSYVHLHDEISDFLLASSDLEHSATNEHCEHSITLAYAHRICLELCMDLISFEVADDTAVKIITENATFNFRDKVQGFIANRPLLQYAACNWYQHAVEAKDEAITAFHGTPAKAMFDISRPQFWIWSLLAFEQVVFSAHTWSAEWHDEKCRAEIWDGKGRRDKGVFIRDDCLKKFGRMNDKTAALFFDDLNTEALDRQWDDCVTWSADLGYDLIDRFHLANEDWLHTSTSKAVEALKLGDVRASAVLAQDTNVASLIWTALQNGAPLALKEATALTDSLEWLNEIPADTLMCHEEDPGLLSRGGTAAEARKAHADRQKQRNEQYPATFEIMMKANTLPSSFDLFSVLAAWITRLSGLGQDYAARLWNAGGFISPVLCRALIDCGAEIDAPVWSDHVTALQVAATFWEHKTIETLLDLGANPMVNSPEVWNTLHWFCFAQGGLMRRKKLAEFPERLKKKAILSSLEAILTKATDSRALMNQPSIDGVTPLMLAVEVSPTIVTAMLERGADVDQTDCSGRTALMCFFLGDGWTQRRTSILHALLVAGADPQLPDDEGHTALGLWAQQLRSDEIGNLFPGKNAYNNSFNAFNTIGKLAAADKMSQALRCLNIPLALAVRLGNVQLCKYLLEVGSDPNQHGLDSSMTHNSGSNCDFLEDLAWNPFLIAVTQQANVLATLLLQHGANVHFAILEVRRKWSAHKVGTTALHYVVSGMPDVGDRPVTVCRVEIPCSYSAGCCFRTVGHLEQDVPSKSTNDMLYKLGERSRVIHRKLRKELLANEDSDPEIETSRQAHSNDRRGAELLPFDRLEQMPNSSLPFSSHPSLKNIYSATSTTAERQHALTKLILDLGVDSNATTRDGITPLSVCVGKNDLDLAELLLDNGADADLAMSDGCTPLMVAAKKGNLTMVRLLLERGSSVDAQMLVPPPAKCPCSEYPGKHGYPMKCCRAPATALVIAVAYRRRDIVELLLDHGADPNLQIVHHVHGRLETKKEERRRKKRRHSFQETSDEDSGPEDEIWKGYITTATALSWARGEIRDLMLERGADSAFEEIRRECDCEVIEQIQNDDQD